MEIVLPTSTGLSHHRIKLVGKPKWYKRSKEILKYILPELLMNSKKETVSHRDLQSWLLPDTKTKERLIAKWTLKEYLILQKNIYFSTNSWTQNAVL